MTVNQYQIAKSFVVCFIKKVLITSHESDQFFPRFSRGIQKLRKWPSLTIHQHHQIWYDDDNDELSRKFLANIFDLFHGIVHRMSKVVVLLHFADPSFRPGPAHKKVHLREMEKRPDGRRQGFESIFWTPHIFFVKYPFLLKRNSIAKARPFPICKRLFHLLESFKKRYCVFGSN